MLVAECRDEGTRESRCVAMNCIRHIVLLDGVSELAALLLLLGYMLMKAIEEQQY